MRRFLAFLLTVVVMSGSHAWAADDGAPLANTPGSDKDIAARLMPIGKSCHFGDPNCGAPVVAATGTGLSGQDIYGKFCIACHGTGAAGAPKFGVKADWAPREGKGMDTLAGSMSNGFKGMPPRGTCAACTDDELMSTLKYMLENAK